MSDRPDAIRIEILNDVGRSVVDADAEWKKLASGFAWAEGPVYLTSSDCLIFSDIPGDAMHKWSEGVGLETFRKPSNFTNGNCLDKIGRLVSCEHKGRSVTRTDLTTMKVNVVVDHHDGKPFNSPNDVVVKSDGSIFFTDPDYGCQINEGHGKMPEQAGNYVYCVLPGTSVAIPVITDMLRPNGLCFSPDESLLYVADSGAARYPKNHEKCQIEFNWSDPHHVRVYDIVNGHETRNSRLFKTIETIPDGIRTDVQGNLYVSTFQGVEVYSPSGTPLCIIHAPNKTANCSFGGPDNTTLYLTSLDTVWSVKCNIKGSV
ncbi:gluconolactonase-like [Corticium candelabrum]|uniref:gluconolactonase-like n=1 Tax=Corticium candelabrum TaxID=121492 RepID=UPI002E25C372|nr:gluconolactonase-like [Corticium candelabrum]